MPGMTLSTDIIVGFPGETEADFRHTLSLIEEVASIGASFSSTRLAKARRRQAWNVCRRS